MFGLSTISMGVGAVSGALVMLGIATAYNKFVDNPHVIAIAKAEAEQEAMKRTFEAIDEVQNAADKARAMRAFCAANGKLYDFGANKCRE